MVAVAHAVDLLEDVDGLAPAVAGRRHILRSQMNIASAAAASAAVVAAAA